MGHNISKRNRKIPSAEKEPEVITSPPTAPPPGCRWGYQETDLFVTSLVEPNDSKSHIRVTLIKIKTKLKTNKIAPD